MVLVLYISVDEKLIICFRFLLAEHQPPDPASNGP